MLRMCGLGSRPPPYKPHGKPGCQVPSGASLEGSTVSQCAIVLRLVLPTQYLVLYSPQVPARCIRYLHAWEFAGWDLGLWIMGYGLWIVDCGQVVGRLWVGCGLGIQSAIPLPFFIPFRQQIDIRDCMGTTFRQKLKVPNLPNLKKALSHYQSRVQMIFYTLIRMEEKKKIKKARLYRTRPLFAFQFSSPTSCSLQLSLEGKYLSNASHANYIINSLATIGFILPCYLTQRLSNCFNL